MTNRKEQNVFQHKCMEYIAVLNEAILQSLNGASSKVTRINKHFPNYLPSAT